MNLVVVSPMDRAGLAVACLGHVAVVDESKLCPLGL